MKEKMPNTNKRSANGMRKNPKAAEKNNPKIASARK